MKRASAILIFLCCFALVCGTFIVLTMTCLNEPKVCRIIVQTTSDIDSTKQYTFIDKLQTDSLINSIRNYDNQLTQKYQYYVEQEEKESTLFTWGSMIVSTVIAILGWFGFSSFKTIDDRAMEKAEKKAEYIAEKMAEEKAIEIAEKKAEVIATEIAKSTSNEYLEKHLTDEVNKCSETYFSSKDYNTLKEQIKGELIGYINNDLKEPEDKQSLDDRLDNLEANMRKYTDDAIARTINSMQNKEKNNAIDQSKKNDKTEA